MKKISYRNILPRGGSLPATNRLPNIGNADSSTESGGRNGYLFTGLPDTHQLPDAPITTEHVSLVDDFLSMADELDDEGLESEADFIDFLIHKFAAVSGPISEEEKYIEYIYKIYNSDIPNSISKIKTLTTDYSKNVAEMISKGADKESSKKSSFNSALMRESINA
jgi:hypothetical protein